MPLIESTIDTLRSDIAAGPAELYVIFSAPPEEGGSWCEICDLARPTIERVFGGEAYGLVVYYAKGEIAAPHDWVDEAWHLLGVPSIYRVIDGTPGLPTGYSDAFDADLEAYVRGAEEYEAFLKKTKGDKYNPISVRQEWHVEDWEVLKRMREDRIRKEKEREKETEAAIQAEEKENAVPVEVTKVADAKVDGEEAEPVCVGNVCAV